MPYLGGGAGLIALALWLFAIFDVIGSDESLCRNLPKGMWVLLVIFLPVIGSVSWLIMGRPERAPFSFGGRSFGGAREVPYRTAVRPRGPEDSPQYLSRSQELERRLEEWEAEQAARAKGIEKRDLRAWEEDLARREEELARREATGDSDASAAVEPDTGEGASTEGARATDGEAPPTDPREAPPGPR